MRVSAVDVGGSGVCINDFKVEGPKRSSKIQPRLKGAGNLGCWCNRYFEDTSGSDACFLAVLVRPTSHTMHHSTMTALTIRTSGLALPRIPPFCIRARKHLNLSRPTCNDPRSWPDPSRNIEDVMPETSYPWNASVTLQRGGGGGGGGHGPEASRQA